MYSNVHWSLCFLYSSTNNWMEKPITVLQTLLYARASLSMLKGTTSVHKRVNSLCWFMTVCSALVMKTAEQQMFVGIIKWLFISLQNRKLWLIQRSRYGFIDPICSKRILRLKLMIHLATGSYWVVPGQVTGQKIWPLNTQQS